MAGDRPTNKFAGRSSRSEWQRSVDLIFFAGSGRDAYVCRSTLFRGRDLEKSSSDTRASALYVIIWGRYCGTRHDQVVPFLGIGSGVITDCERPFRVEPPVPSEAGKVGNRRVSPVSPPREVR